MKLLGYLAALVVISTAYAGEPALDYHAVRRPAARIAFMKANPCPANGKTRGACPDYVVDHIKPLCAGGADHMSNMQWQTKAEGLIKDREERKQCRRRKR